MLNKAFVLGNGPGLNRDDVERCDSQAVIAVNEAARMCPTAGVLFARDLSWCLDNQKFIRSWPGRAITTNHRASRELPMEFVAMERRPDFPVAPCPVIRYGPSSGHAAVSWAVTAGAKRIVLLGFDGRPVDGRTHWHDRYREDRDVYARFNEGWRGWSAAAERLGCSILNASVGSAITEFPMIDLDEALA